MNFQHFLLTISSICVLPILPISYVVIITVQSQTLHTSYLPFVCHITCNTLNLYVKNTKVRNQLHTLQIHHLSIAYSMSQKVPQKFLQYFYSW